jgi:hypothetical protein
MASRSSRPRFPPITLSAGTRDRRYRQDGELCAGQMSTPGQGQISTAGRDQKSAFPSATNAPSEAGIRMWGGRISPTRRHWDSGVARGQGGDRRTGARRTRMSPVSPSGPAAFAARLACRSSRYSQPGHSPDRLWYARDTWTCRLICPQDARSPRADGLCSRYGSLSQRYGSLSRQGREGSRTGGGRAPERAGQDGQGTAGGCPGSEARDTSRPGQARMGPGHRLGNRQGSPGAAPARNENGPGCLARQAFDCLGLALAAAGPARASREDHDLRRRSPARVPVGCRRSPGEVWNPFPSNPF